MAWQKVTVDLGKDQIPAMMKGDQLDMPAIVDVGNSITVNKKSYQVLSHKLDERDNRYLIQLAMASTTKEKESSDGKSSKGRS